MLKEAFFLTPSGSICSRIKFLNSILLHSQSSCINLKRQPNTFFSKLSSST